MSILGAIGNTVGGIGSMLGLPEYNISETLGGDRDTGAYYPGMPSTVGNGSNDTQRYETAGDTGGGGMVNGASTFIDPYAAYGGKAAYDAKVSAFDAQKQGIYDSTNEAIGQAGSSLHGSIMDLLDSLRAGQRTVDQSATNNELNKRQATTGIMGAVSRGIQSGGVTLANRNAGSSSAAEAIARAYGDFGNREMGGVNNEYEMGRQNVANQQKTLDEQRATGQRKIGESKNNVVNGIVSNARNALSALDAAIAGASLPDRINIEAEKERIRQDAVSQLQQYDAELNNGVAAINPMGEDAARAKAAEMASAGVAGTNPFQFDTQAPAQFTGTGPFASSLPLFTLPRSKRSA